LREQHRFVRGLAAWVGFKQTSILYVRDARHSGETKYPLKKMVRLAWDAFTGFSRAPLKIATWIGIFSALLALALAVWALYAKWVGLGVVQGWTSLMIVVLFFGGVQLLSIGILGEYIGRIFEQVKDRPLYLVRKRLGNFDRPLRSPEQS
jgi:dolichol-phosphate mannosyltransferase